MGLFPWTPAMTSRLFLLLPLFVIVELSSGKLASVSEDLGEVARQAADGAPAVDQRVLTRESANRDMVSINMFKVYERYSKEPQSQREGNTVRSFKAVPRVSHGKEVFQFNLSSIPDSELVIFASFHFLYKRPRHNQRLWRFRRPRHPSGGLHYPHLSSPQLLFHGTSPNSALATPLGNITGVPFKKGSWQSRDVTAIVKQARDVHALVVTAEFDSEFGMARVQQRSPHGQERLSPANLPYLLVYADDRAIDEPNSVAMSLQRYGPSPLGDDASPSASASASPSASRIRRELHLQIQTNDIPEVHFNTLKNHELWQNTYFPAKAKAAAKTGRKQGQESSEGLSKPQVLSFDERTMKKARRRQWSEPRVCSRRYLRVDFADIGWSEWVLAPKSFDAYYCAGTCGFPIPKIVRPSNHATIQSIVRAVGIVPGIPEPCCVPEKMSPLSVLFLDPNRNMVLKVYPGMSVDTCACR
ncbi:growth/differentiation factor 10 [Echeneis naucrates]|uniref:TGF-beta family profile domain-containing protein n=1 Tax=Echeneis naucrates TaxID=173247 RepID=A0A665UYK3_ECHNA|nr:growth/differentiation factor 10 [Echeneis naucrates]